MLIRGKAVITSEGLIKAEDTEEGVWSARLEGDEVRIFHAQKTDDIDKQNYLEREFGNNGWTLDRSMRKIASIPALEFVKHPEFTHDEVALKKWLRREGRRYLSVKGGV